MKIEKDKYIHAGVSAIIAIVIGVLLAVMDAPAEAVSLISFLCALGIGITKEWCDHLYTKNWSWQYLVADLVGAFVGSLLALLFL